MTPTVIADSGDTGMRNGAIRQWLLAGGYVVSTTVLCLLATAAGIALVRLA